MATQKPTTKKFKREKSTSTKGHYVTNAELLPIVIRDKAAGKMSNELAVMLNKIAYRFSLSPSYIRYSYREDMVSAAMLNLVNKWHKFDETVSNNPFSFYTTAVYHSFLQFLSDEKDETKVKDLLSIQAGMNPSFGFGDDRPMSSDDSAFM